ncbi:MAG: DUF561 domain-containing protein [Candidatus Melainabacteria bacterium]|nr:DUF561 domain-containing protein [Candidatus Melainabacteria bacterium]
MLNISNKEKILNALKSKKLVKIISGIRNYDKQKTLNIAIAAELGEATALDICDAPEIIKAIRASVQLPLFVSSVDPLKLIGAQYLGADVLEIGNYESFYKEGKMFTPSEILEIVKFIKKSITVETHSYAPLLCCTIPATLEIKNQIKLAKKLLDLGVDILQTEGFAFLTPVSDSKEQTYNDVLKAASTLANTIELRKALPNVNIICASGITLTTVPLALSCGASGIGVGNYINSIVSQIEMTEKVKEIMECVLSSYATTLKMTPIRI